MAELNLDKLEKQLDEALAKETPDSLINWLREKRRGEWVIKTDEGKEDV